MQLRTTEDMQTDSAAARRTATWDRFDALMAQEGAAPRPAVRSDPRRAEARRPELRRPVALSRPLAPQASVAPARVRRVPAAVQGFLGGVAALALVAGGLGLAAVLSGDPVTPAVAAPAAALLAAPAPAPGPAVVVAAAQPVGATIDPMPERPAQPAAPRYVAASAAMVLSAPYAAAPTARPARLATAAVEPAPRPWVLILASNGGAVGAEADLRAAGFEDVRTRPALALLRAPQARFFHPEDRAAAEQAIKALGAPVELADFTSYRPSPAPGLIEVWLPADARREG